MGQARVHAGDYGDAFVGILGCSKILILLFFDKALIIFKNLFNHISAIYYSQIKYIPNRAAVI